MRFIRGRWIMMLAVGAIVGIAGFVGVALTLPTEQRLVTTGTVAGVLQEAERVTTTMVPAEKKLNKFHEGSVLVETEVGMLRARACLPTPPSGSTVRVSYDADDRDDTYLEGCGFSPDIEGTVVSNSLTGVSLAGWGVAALAVVARLRNRGEGAGAAPTGMSEPQTTEEPPTPRI